MPVTVVVTHSEGIQLSGLDDFLAARKAEREKQQQLREEELSRETQKAKILREKVIPEWTRLKEIIRTRVEGIDIEGLTITEQGDMFRLGQTALMLQSGAILNGVPQVLRAIFSRNPNGIYMEESRVDPVIWQIDPAIENSDLLWTVEAEAGAGSATTERLAELCIESLVSYHDTYEAAYGR